MYEFYSTDAYLAMHIPPLTKEMVPVCPPVGFSDLAHVPSGDGLGEVISGTTDHENLVILDDPDVLVRFQREFRRLWREAKE